MKSNEKAIIVRCPICNQRVFDTISEASGVIRMKCPRCKHLININLSINRVKTKYNVISNSA